LGFPSALESKAFPGGIEAISPNHILAWKYARDETSPNLVIAGTWEVMTNIRKDQLPSCLSEFEGERQALRVR
jgi:hypothetical protein